MEFKAFEEFVYIMLVNASQAAYHEEAHTTHTLLSNLNVFYKYMIKDDECSLLSEEMDALKHYYKIQNVRYGNRFEISINGCFEEDVFIDHASIIAFIDYTLVSLLNRHEDFFWMNLSIVIKESTILLEALVETEGKKEFHSKSFAKRGGRLCTNS